MNELILSDPVVLDSIEKAVADTEKKTCAEVVAVLAPQSGSYLDREMLVGLTAGVVTLSVLVIAPVGFHPVMALVDFLIAFTVGTLIANRLWLLKRLATFGNRRSKNVTAGALIAFQTEGVSATPGRHGILVYASVFEREIRIIPDLGVEAKVPGAEWNLIMASAGKPAPREMGRTLVDVIGKIGDALSSPMPPCVENPDEMPNRPRIVR